MIRIYPEKLAAQLEQGLSRCYMLFGDEPLQMQEAQDAIRQKAKQQDFLEQHRFVIDQHTDWQPIFSCCQSLSLFSSRQLLLLQLPESGINAAIAAQLHQLYTLLHDDILLLLMGNKLTKAQENGAWFKALADHTLYITCQTPDVTHLSRWINQRAKSMKLTIDEQSIQLLCYYYEGNLLALSQALARLALLYPDGKLTLPRLQHATHDAAQFTPYHWLDALLAGKTKRGWHILQQLNLSGTEPLYLVRALQKELLLLLRLKQSLSAKHAGVSLKHLFDQQHVWQNRRPLLSQALERLTLNELRQALSLLMSLELTLKQEFGKSVWHELETLSMLLCGKKLPEVNIHAG